MQKREVYMSKPKKIPAFKSEAEERKFWETHDSTNYIDWSKAEHVHFPNLKPSTKSISIRLPESLLEEIKILANKQDVPYQSLIKILINQGLRNQVEQLMKFYHNLFKRLIDNRHKKTTHKTTDTELGEVIKSIRNTMNLNSEQFSKKVNIKTSTLKAIERGEQAIDSKLEKKIEKIFSEDQRV